MCTALRPHLSASMLQSPCEAQPAWLGHLATTYIACRPVWCKHDLRACVHSPCWPDITSALRDLSACARVKLPNLTHPQSVATTVLHKLCSCQLPSVQVSSSLWQLGPLFQARLGPAKPPSHARQHWRLLSFSLTVCSEQVVNLAELQPMMQAGAAVFGINISVGISMGIAGARMSTAAGILKELPHDCMAVVGIQELEVLRLLSYMSLLLAHSL